jgi:hypothetical protein
MKESRQKAPSHVSDSIWLIAVPKAEFSEPPFHFGERVKWWIDDKGVRHYLTGRIWGCWYSESEIWEYYIKLDAHQNIGIELEDFVFLNPTELRKVSDSSSMINQLKPNSSWFMTREAAAHLGVSPDQLRNLRSKGLFKSGVHYRDSSVPGSARPCWQWHVERCHQALEVPPEKRPIKRR